MTIMDIILNLQRYSTEVLAYKLDAEFAAAVDAAANLLEAQGERMAEYECTGYSPADFDRLCREMSDLRMAAGIDTYENLREALRSGYLKVVKTGDLTKIKAERDAPTAFLKKVASCESCRFYDPECNVCVCLATCMSGEHWEWKGADNGN